MAPSAMIVALGVAALLPLFLPAVWPLSLLVIGGYALIIASASVVLANRERFPYPHYIATSLLALHFGYGLGMIRGLVDLVRGR
jgi:hypothetical protein